MASQVSDLHSEKIISHGNMLSSVSIVTQRIGMLSPLNNPSFLLLHLLLGAGEVRPVLPQGATPHTGPTCSAGANLQESTRTITTPSPLFATPALH